MKHSNIPEWDLSDLYLSITDPKIKSDKLKINQEIESLTKKYKNLSLEKNLKLYEKIKEKLSILDNYAFLNYSTTAKDEKVSKFYQDTREFVSNAEAKLLGFELFLIKNKNIVKGYEYFLKSLRIFKPFTLNEEREVILTKKNQSGRDAFTRLYDQLDSSIEFKGKTYSEVASIFSNHKDRNKRKEAGKTIQKYLKDNSKLYSFVLNTLLLDKKNEDEIRGFAYPQQSTFLNYDVDLKTVKTMSDTIVKNYNVSERYYLAKSKLLGLKLEEWDRYNDIYPEIKSKTNWPETKNMVLNSFERFSNRFAQEAKKLIDNNWIDAKVKIGKTSGAYCSYVSNSLHPYVFMNFAGNPRDVSTLAHELGHAVHGILAQNNTYLEFRPSTATAEIASVFAENLLFDDLYNMAKTKKEKINLLGNKLQDSFATVFRQNTFYLFESKLHELRRNRGELSSDEICNLYQEYLQPMFGKGLTLSDGHKYMWMIISHFYHYNFYVFTYSFGQLLASSLYAVYKKEGSKFVNKYLSGLKLGGSKSPIEVTKSMGLDITKNDFWQNGLDLINNQVEEFESLTK